jgi:sulfate adenylyltransferase
VRDANERARLVASCAAAHECSERNACDVELLTVGGFSPLEGFMSQPEYEAVVDTRRLPGSGLLFGLPVVMDTDDEALAPGQRLLLTYRGQELGVLDVESKWAPNKAKEAKLCYGTSSLEHPGVSMIASERGRFYVGGRLHGFELPRRVFPCATPADVRAALPAGADVVAFQCRNPIHRAHYELFTRALRAPNVRDGAVCLVHPTVGPTQVGCVGCGVLCVCVCVLLFSFFLCGSCGAPFLSHTHTHSPALKQKTSKKTTL